MSGRRTGPLFAGGEGDEGGGGEARGPLRLRDERFSQIVCASCGTIVGMALNGAGGLAYCGECWEKMAADDMDAAEGAGAEEGRRDPGAEEGAQRGEYGGGNGDDESGGDKSGADPDRLRNGPHGGGGASGGGGEQARRLRAIMRSLAGGRGNRPPTRRQVLDAMVRDGGGGAWKDNDAAEWCLDNALGSLLYEPEAGRLAAIGE